MITSDTRAGSMLPRSSAALMATAPRSWAGRVANAPLKLPTGVRAALTMTTSSDIGISWGLRFLNVGGRRKRGASLPNILLTELRHVNGAAAELCGPALHSGAPHIPDPRLGAAEGSELPGPRTLASRQELPCASFS